MESSKAAERKCKPSPGGYGQFCADLIDLLDRGTVVKLGTIFLLPHAVIEELLEGGQHTVSRFVREVNSRGIIAPNDIDALLDALRRNKLGDVADKVQMSFKSNVEAEQVNHSEYPFLSEGDFEKYKTNIRILNHLHMKSSKDCENRFRRYSLEINKDLSKATSSTVDHLRVVMVGKTGSGKSATANSILGAKEFVEGETSVSATESSCIATRELGDGRRLSVVDCPGIKDTERNREEVILEIARIAFLLREGVHAFILVWDDTRFTEEAKEVLREIQEEFGDQSMTHCILVYSFAESKFNGTHLDSYVKSQKEHREMKTFLDVMDWKVVAVNNKTDIPAEKRRNQEIIVAMIDAVIRKKPKAYTNDSFQKAKQLHLRIKKRCSWCHPALVAAVVEVFDHYQWYLMGKEEIFDKTVTLLRKSQTGRYVIGDGAAALELHHSIHKTHLPRYACEKQVFFIFDALGGEIKEFAKELSMETRLTISAFGKGFASWFSE